MRLAFVFELFCCLIGYGRDGKRSRLDEIEWDRTTRSAAANYMTPELVFEGRLRWSRPARPMRSAFR